MSVINPLAREISAKVVYYGPGLSGKTTSLKHIYSVVKPQRRGELVTLVTEGDRTIFFDFLPLHVKEVQGMGVRFQLYTVPGQVFYEATRKLVLSGADGVVFVADSRPAARDDNFESLANLRANLEENDLDVETFPIVFQYNKRDLPGAMSASTMSAELNWLGAPEFETAATIGEGVLPALKETSKLVIRSILARMPQRPQRRARAKAAPEGIEAELARVSAELTTVSGEVAISEVESQPPPSVHVPKGALSFSTLWEGADAIAVLEVENAIRKGEHGRAMELAVRAMVELLDALPGTTGESASPMAKAALLGLDGREFLRFCRLASLHQGSTSDKDALFALYMLVSARLKASQV